MERQLSSVPITVREVIADAIRDSDGLHGWTTFMLIDPILGDPLGDIGGEERERTSLPINPTLMSEVHFPYLIMLGEVGRDSLIDSALERAIDEVDGRQGLVAGARSVCAFFVTKHSSKMVAKRLAESASVRVDGERRLFRFWDPRVMDLLTRFAGSDEIETLLSPAERWCWIARDGRAESLTMVAESQNSKLQLLNTERFLNFGRINKFFDVLKSDAFAIRKIDCVSVDRIMRKGLEKWLLQSDYEVVSYALHSILLGEGFDDDEQVRWHMDNGIREGRSPVVELEALSEVFWTALSERLGQVAYRSWT